jgi:hypothetical protein
MLQGESRPKYQEQERVSGVILRRCEISLQSFRSVAALQIISQPTYGAFGAAGAEGSTQVSCAMGPAAHQSRQLDVIE